MSLILCPYCGKEVEIDSILEMFKCKFRLESASLEEINKISGSPFVTVRHGDLCFPFGVRYNNRTKRFRIEK